MENQRYLPDTQSETQEKTHFIPLALDVTGRTAIQGEPGTGKVRRMGTGTNQERAKRGLKLRRNALWMQCWRKDPREKYPGLSFAEWQAAMERLHVQARQDEARATSRERVVLLAADRNLQAQLIDAALADEQVQSRVAALAQKYTPPDGKHDLSE